MNRRSDCRKYDECLDLAAKANWRLLCDRGECADYEPKEAVEIQDDFVSEMKRMSRSVRTETTSVEGPERSEPDETRSDRKESIMDKKTCKVEGCESKTVARGLCGAHYDRWRRNDEEMVRLMGGPFKAVRTTSPGTGRRNKVAAMPPGRVEWTPNPEEEAELDRVRKVIRILSAAGLVSDEQVQAAYHMAGV